jgi:hypothetical protein
MPVRPAQEYEFQNWFLHLKFLKSALQSGNEILSDLNNKLDVHPGKTNSVLPGENQGTSECPVNVRSGLFVHSAQHRIPVFPGMVAV